VTLLVLYLFCGQVVNDNDKNTRSTLELNNYKENLSSSNILSIVWNQYSLSLIHTSNSPTGIGCPKGEAILHPFEVSDNMNILLVVANFNGFLKLDISRNMGQDGAEHAHISPIWRL
jgi:hypothetical protein